MKKILALLLSVITLFASTVSLSGCLTMEKLNELSLEVKRYDDSVVIVGIERVYDSNLKIPETIFGLPVTGIAGSAFNECKEIESVSIPKTVKVIGNNAFAKCTSLKKVVFEGKSQLESMGASIFADCLSLRKIKIPETVSSIGAYAFSGCDLLKKVVFEGKSQLNTIEGKVFNDCLSLRKIKIPETVSSIGAYAFSGCASLKKVVFEGKSQLKTIKGNAFNGCRSLRKIKIPESVVEMEKFVFDNSGVEKIYCEVTSKPVLWQYGWNSLSYGYSDKIIETVGGYKGFIGDIRMWLGL